MPLNVDENYIAQLWSMAEVSRLNTGGGEGVEIIKNEFFPVPTNYNDITKHLPDYDLVTEPQKEQKAKKLHASKSCTAMSNHENSHSSSNNNGKEKANSCTKDDSYNNNNGDPCTLTKQNSDSNSEASIYSSLPNSMGSTDNLTTKFDKTYINKSEGNSSSDSMNEQNLAASTRKGQYTYKVYKIASKFPWFIRKILPHRSTILHEKSWNLYPIIKTHIRNEYMKEKFHVYINTITKECIDGKADENVHNLTAEQLQKREIIVVDICEPVSSGEYVADEDPTKFHSVKANRGPLKEDWISNQRPLICCYKLVDLEFSWFGFQSKAESFMGTFYKKLFKKFHRQIFCWMDKWYDVKIEDVRKYEIELQKALSENIKNGEIAKNPFEEDNSDKS